MPARAPTPKTVGMGLTIGVDVGGTKVAAGVVDEDGQVVEKLKRYTPAASPDDTVDVIAGAVTELLSRYTVDAVGIGAAAGLAVRCRPHELHDRLHEPLVAVRRIRFGVGKYHAPRLLAEVGRASCRERVCSTV